MTDIVERLQMRRDPLTDGERAEAADEIERLRELLRESNEYIEELREEIERLNQKLATPCYTALWDETEKRVLLTKEVERLRNALEISCGARELANQETERLRESAEKRTPRLSSSGK